jgi:hypothetical protein
MQSKNPSFSGANLVGIEKRRSPTYDSPCRQGVATKHWYPPTRQWVSQPLDHNLNIPCHENMKVYSPAR